ncbi:MAG: hypothetical protein V8S95_13975 [Odoribacter sp.]
MEPDTKIRTGSVFGHEFAKNMVPAFDFRDAAVGTEPHYVIGYGLGMLTETRPGLVGIRAAAPILFEVAGLLPSTSQSSSSRNERMQEMAVYRKQRVPGFWFMRRNRYGEKVLLSRQAVFRFYLLHSDGCPSRASDC